MLKPEKSKQERPGETSHILPSSLEHQSRAFRQLQVLHFGLASQVKFRAVTPHRHWSIQQELGISLQHLFHPLLAISVHLQSKFGAYKNVRGSCCRLVSGTGATVWEGIHSPLTVQAPSRAKEPNLAKSIIPFPSGAPQTLSPQPPHCTEAIS